MVASSLRNRLSFSTSPEIPFFQLLTSVEVGVNLALWTHNETISHWGHGYSSHFTVAKSFFSHAMIKLNTTAEMLRLWQYIKKKIPFYYQMCPLIFTNMKKKTCKHFFVNSFQDATVIREKPICIILLIWKETNTCGKIYFHAKNTF